MEEMFNLLQLFKDDVKTSQTLALPLIDCVTQGWSLTSSVPLFHIGSSLPQQGASESKMILKD